jgi:hypothetical protein
MEIRDGLKNLKMESWWQEFTYFYGLTLLQVGERLVCLTNSASVRVKARPSDAICRSRQSSLNEPDNPEARGGLPLPTNLATGMVLSAFDVRSAGGI